MKSMSVKCMQAIVNVVATKSHCKTSIFDAKYVQQHPTRLGKKLLLKLSGYLFLKPLKV